jgi:hypothetical protein
VYPLAYSEREMPFFVPIYIVRAAKQTGVRRHVLTGAKGQFERFETVQLSVQIDCNLAERVMMKVERILIAVTVIGSIVDESHDQSGRQLTGE